MGEQKSNDGSRPIAEAVFAETVLTIPRGKPPPEKPPRCLPIPGQRVFLGFVVKLVLLHKADSIYEDEPDSVYDFPKSYLRSVREGTETGSSTTSRSKAGARGYFAVAKIARVIENACCQMTATLALIEPGTFLPFGQ